jgi:flavorubredoxin
MNSERGKMAHEYLKEIDNVYCIDTVFFGFPRFNAAYLIKGADKITHVDTEAPPSLERVKKSVENLGVKVEDIDYIFCTHCEHPDKM